MTDVPRQPTTRCSTCRRKLTRLRVAFDARSAVFARLVAAFAAVGCGHARDRVCCGPEWAAGLARALVDSVGGDFYLLYGGLARHTEFNDTMARALAIGAAPAERPVLTALLHLGGYDALRAYVTRAP